MGSTVRGCVSQQFWVGRSSIEESGREAVQEEGGGGGFVVVAMRTKELELTKFVRLVY